MPLSSGSSGQSSADGTVGTETGDAAVLGETGEAGVFGDAGDATDFAETVERGVTGDATETGDFTDTGETTVCGVTGETTDCGVTGETTETGLTGDTGDGEVIADGTAVAPDVGSTVGAAVAVVPSVERSSTPGPTMSSRLSPANAASSPAPTPRMPTAPVTIHAPLFIVLPSGQSWDAGLASRPGTILRPLHERSRKHR